MYLLHTETKTLHEFSGDDIPSYAILSHRWGSPAEELKFRDVREGTHHETSGLRKMRNACRVAKLKYNMDYIWIDTCCINKESSAELSEAINSMFMWYRNAAICIAFLSDVRSGSQDSADAFRQSEWFTRAWTLQELLAPRVVEFFNDHWESIGTRADKIDLIEEATRIPSSALQDSDCLWEFNVIHKMLWASGRKASRKEDIAYSLMGIFDVNIPLLYGEGEKAFIRLQEEIIRQANNTLFLWWGIDTPTQRLLADSPSSFETGIDLYSYDSFQPFSWTNVGLQLETKIFRYGIDLYGMILAWEEPDSACVIILRKELFIDNTYHKVCTASIYTTHNYLSREGNITIMRGTRDQRIGEQDTHYARYDLLQQPYLVEVQSEGDVTINPDMSSADSLTNPTPPSWHTIGATSVYQATFEDPGHWSVASLTCEFAASHRSRLSFAFDFDWCICLLIEREWAQNSSIYWHPKTSLRRISTENPGTDYGTSQNHGWHETSRAHKVSSSEDELKYFVRLPSDGHSCWRLPGEIVPRTKSLWVSLYRPHIDKWVLEISETAPYHT